MTITLMTCVYNRLEHLQQTLLQNIEDNLDCDHLEYLVLNYNSTDESEQWAQEVLTPYIKQGIVTYYHEQAAHYFNFSHARNVAARLAEGSIICNVDADNYTGKGFANFLQKQFNTSDRVLCAPDTHWMRRPPSWAGRLAYRKQDFIGVLGGYNEYLIYGYSCEDADLLSRARDLGFRIIAIPEQFLRFMIPHSHLVRSQGHRHINALSRAESGRKNTEIACAHYQTSLKANSRLHWGHAVVKKNFNDALIAI